MRGLGVMAVGVGVLAIGLACSGLGLGPGATVATAPLTSGSQVTASHTATTDEVGVWLTLDLDYVRASGGSSVGTLDGYRIQGPVEVAVNGTPVLTDALDMTAEDGPLAGSSSRFVFGETKSSFNGAGSHAARLWLYTAEGLTPGDTVSVTVTPQISPNVTARTLTVDLTE